MESVLYSMVVSGSLNSLVIYNHPVGSIYYIPLIYCQLGDYLLPTTYEGNQETPLMYVLMKIQIFSSHLIVILDK